MNAVLKFEQLPLSTEPVMMPRMRLVLETVARLHCLPIERLWSAERPERVVAARFHAIYALRRLSRLTHEEIAVAFNRDRTAVIYALNVVQDRCTVADDYRKECELVVLECARALRGIKHQAHTVIFRET